MVVRFSFSRRSRDSFGRYGDPSSLVGKCRYYCGLKEDFSRWHDVDRVTHAVLHFEIQFHTSDCYPIRTGKLCIGFSYQEPNDNGILIKEFHPRSGLTGEAIPTSWLQHKDEEPDVGAAAANMAAIKLKCVGKNETTKAKVDKTWRLSSFPLADNAILWQYHPMSPELSPNYNRPFQTAVYLVYNSEQQLTVTTPPQIEPLLRRDRFRLSFANTTPSKSKRIDRGSNCEWRDFELFLRQLAQEIEQRNHESGALGIADFTHPHFVIANI